MYEMTKLKKTVRIFAFISYFVATSAMGAIRYGNQSYVAPFAASTTQQVAGLVSSTGADLNNLTSSSSISAGLGFLGSIKNFFINIDSWLKIHAGINLFAILTTIGHWFMITLEWIIMALKAIL